MGRVKAKGEEHMNHKEVMQMALDALETHAKQYPHMVKGYTVDAVQALRAALAQPEPKPVAWTTDLEFDYDTEIIPAKEKGRLGTSTNDIPLYTAPPQREWQGLTDEEAGGIMEDLNAYGTRLDEYAKAIEAKIKEKNYDKR
jgi:hypothetical protein